MIVELTQDTFDEALKTEGTIIIDFWSTNCGPCKIYSNILGWVEKENPDTPIYKLNVDEALELAKKYQISSVPTTIFFKNGEEQERLIGMQPKCKLNSTIKKYE